MDVQIKNEIFGDCKLSFEPGINLIYGYNNKGKTLLLVQIDNYCDSKLYDKSFEYSYSLLIPTNRIIIKPDSINDSFELLEKYAYKKQKKNFICQYNIVDGKIERNKVDYRTHLGNIREYLLKNLYIKKMIKDIIKRLFGIKYNYNSIYSDGVENIINIYLNIIWIALISNNYTIKNYDNNNIYRMLRNSKMVVLIDEIEAYLHASIIDMFLKNIQEIFTNTIFIFSTHSPLVLSRANAKKKYRLNDGEIVSNEENVYYESTDKINEIDFDVPPWPNELESAMIYIDKCVRNRIKINSKKLKKYIKLVCNYENIKKDYYRLICLAEILLERK